MKRSEVIKRLREPLNAAVGMSRANNVNYAGEGLALIEEGCILAIAQALGITVEPDEPELPEHLVLDHCGGPGYRLMDDSEGGAIWGLTGINLTCPSHEARKLLDALIAAYNNRPRWRTGDPPGDGEYVVARPGGKLAVRTWKTVGSLGGYWSLDGSYATVSPTYRWLMGPLPE